MATYQNALAAWRTARNCNDVAGMVQHMEMLGAVRELSFACIVAIRDVEVDPQLCASMTLLVRSRHKVKNAIGDIRARTTSAGLLQEAKVEPAG